MTWNQYAARNLHMAHINRKPLWIRSRKFFPKDGSNDVKDHGVLLLYSRLNHTNIISLTSTTSPGGCVFHIRYWMESPNHFNTPYHDVTILLLLLMLEQIVFELSPSMLVRDTIKLQYDPQINKKSFFAPENNKYCFSIIPFGPTNAPILYSSIMINFKYESDKLFII